MSKPRTPPLGTQQRLDTVLEKKIMTHMDFSEPNKPAVRARVPHFAPHLSLAFVLGLSTVPYMAYGHPLYSANMVTSTL